MNLQRLFTGLRAETYVALEAAVAVLALCGPSCSAAAVHGRLKNLRRTVRVFRVKQLRTRSETMGPHVSQQDAIAVELPV